MEKAYLDVGTRTYYANLEPNKTYTLVVQGHSNEIDCHIKILTIPDDYNDEFGVATPIALVSTVQGNIEVPDLGESDMFSFQTTGNDSYYLISNTTIGDNTTHMYLYDGTDESYKMYDTYVYKGDTTIKEYKLKKNSTYYIRAKGDSRTSYKINVTELIDNAGDDFATAKTIKNNTKIKGTMELDWDTDFYKVQTDKNKTAYHMYFIVDNKKTYAGKWTSIKKASLKK